MITDTGRPETVAYLHLDDNDQPTLLPCPECRLPSGWWAAGVSGCPRRCGAVTHQQVMTAEAVIRDYRRKLLTFRASRTLFLLEHRGYGTDAARRRVVSDPELNAAVTRLQQERDDDRTRVPVS